MELSFDVNQLFKEDITKVVGWRPERLYLLCFFQEH